MWEPSLFQGRPLVPLKKVANGDIWFFTEWNWNQRCCHGNNIVGVTLFLMWCTFMVPSLKITAPIFLEIFLIQYFIVFVKDLWRHHFPHLHNTKTWISLKRKKIFQKGKRHSSLLWKAFQISSNYFLLHRDFKSVRFPNFRYSTKQFAHIYRVWSRHVGVLPWYTNIAVEKCCQHLELTLAI